MVSDRCLSVCCFPWNNSEGGANLWRPQAETEPLVFRAAPGNRWWGVSALLRADAGNAEPTNRIL
jgi:hypothetical protein